MAVTTSESRFQVQTSSYICVYKKTVKMKMFYLIGYGCTAHPSNTGVCKSRTFSASWPPPITKTSSRNAPKRPAFASKFVQNVLSDTHQCYVHVADTHAAPAFPLEQPMPKTGHKPTCPGSPIALDIDSVPYFALATLPHVVEVPA